MGAVHYSKGWSGILCGVDYGKGRRTSGDPGEVTCTNCKRSKKFPVRNRSEARKSSIHWEYRGKPRCGAAKSDNQTTVRKEVTCTNCKRTKSFKEGPQQTTVKPEPDTHDHEYRFFGWQGTKWLVFKCKDCREEVRRAPTKHELSILNSRHEQTLALHTLIREFREEFWVSMDERPIRWKLYGADLIEAIERWADNKPDVRVVSVDDDTYAGAVLVLIEHRTKDYYHGTTVYYVSQFQLPVQFFLYPDHRDDLQEALASITSAHTKSLTTIKKSQERYHREIEKWRP